MRFPKVSIIVLNWNGGKDTVECLWSLYRVTYPNYEVIIVDNGSSDDSVEMIKRWAEGELGIDARFGPFKKKIKYFEYTLEELKSNKYFRRKQRFDPLPANEKLFLLKNDKNYGFTGGNNMAINQVLQEKKSDYLLLLNNDTVVDKNFLTKLIKVGESDKNIGILGPKIYYYNFHKRKNVIQSVGTKVNLYTGRFLNYGDGQINREQFDEVRAVDHISGACLLIKREVIRKIGLLDERFFAYFEDVDWCLRARKKEYQIFCVPKAFIWHKGGKSLENRPEFSVYIQARNIFLIEKKHASPLQFLFFLGYYFLFRFPRRIGYCCLSKNKIGMLTNYLKGLGVGVLGR